MEKKDLIRITGGSGTMADPLRVRNDVEWQLVRILEQGYNYELVRIAEVREILEKTDMSPEQRKDYEHRIAVKEYRSKGARSGYLVTRAFQEYVLLKRAKKEWESQKVIQGLTQKYESSFEAAQGAHKEFLAFAKAHPDLKKEHERKNETYFMSPEQKLEKLCNLTKQQFSKHDR